MTIQILKLAEIIRDIVQRADIYEEEDFTLNAYHFDFGASIGPMGQDPQTVLFQVVFALLFGFRASVMHYLTWAEFQQAFARRLLVLMWSTYVDDSSIVDLGIAHK